MCETPFMFSEFAMTAGDMTDELRHQKRMRMEPLIFDVLKKKYSAALDTFWETYTPPVQSDRCVLIVERRIHENLEFVLKNAAYFCRGWSLCFVCSDLNLDYCRAIAGKHADNIHYIVAYRGNPDRDTGRREHTLLLKNADFYAGMPWKHLIFSQEDAYFRRPVPERLVECYDFAASPAFWDTSMMVGGISYRNRDAMVRVCREFQEDIFWEDCFFDKGTKALGLRRPAFQEALDYFGESCFSEDPIAVHQWWTYFYLDMEDADYFFRNLLRLEID
jgi:hypothetical protein